MVLITCIVVFIHCFISIFHFYAFLELFVSVMMLGVQDVFVVDLPTIVPFYFTWSIWTGPGVVEWCSKSYIRSNIIWYNCQTRMPACCVG